MDFQSLISLLTGSQNKNNDLNLGQIMNFFSQNAQSEGQQQKNMQNQNLTQILPLLSLLGGQQNGQINIAGLMPLLSGLFNSNVNNFNNTQTEQPKTQCENKKTYLNENAKKISEYKIIE